MFDRGQSARIPIYIGWDSREDIAYQVCRRSLLRHATVPLDVMALKQSSVRQLGLYWRETDELASTEFTYTRFLVPVLNKFQGWAIFMDCDFLFTGDIAELLSLADPKYAVMCVKHDYRPTETTKMDGQKQTVYPRKNWSSLMLINCGHHENRVLTKEVVNEKSGKYLHRFEWLSDDLIGDLPEKWNWLEGWNKIPSDDTSPAGIHFTRGGPWFEQYQDVDYGDLWLNEKAELERENVK